MAHFKLTESIPVLPRYLFEADLEVSVITPQTYTAVPTKDGKAFLHWEKHVNTSDAVNDLYTEVYRSDDLETWELIATRQWLNYDDYTDEDVLVDKVYYYRLRFVRKDADDVVTTASSYTIPLSVRIVTLLGFEPSDTYSNKFFKYLIDSLPGTRIYDHTNAANFSAEQYFWQTTSKILDGFTVKADGSTVATEGADATALYAKRPVSFFLDKKHVKLQGTELSTGVEGEQVQINSYLIYTFFMGYAVQFLTLYETYLQIVANKFIDYSQAYTKGFKPVVSDRKDPELADVFYSFGQLMGLKPLRAQTFSQGMVRYKEMLKNSFSNLDSLGERKAIAGACQDTLGITTQTLLEYYKQHWFKSDREHKLYAIPSGSDSPQYTTTLPSGNNNLQYLSGNDAFWSLLEYVADASGIGLTGIGEGWLEVLGSSADNPYDYLFKVHISEGVTTAFDVVTLMATDPVASLLLSVNNSGGDTGLGAIYEGFDAQLMKVLTPWVGWEDTNIKMYGNSYKLKDTVSTLTTGDDVANMSRMLSSRDPNEMLRPVDGTAIPSTVTEKTEYEKLSPDDALIIARDDNNAGVSYTKDITYTVLDSGTTDASGNVDVTVVDAGKSFLTTVKPFLDIGDEVTFVNTTDNTSSPVISASSDIVLTLQNTGVTGNSKAYEIRKITPITFVGNKNVLFKINMTTSNMDWVTKASLKIFVDHSTSAGYLRLYRIKKRYNSDYVCWNYRNRENIPESGTAWNWNNLSEDYIASSAQQWVTEDWETDGALGDADRVFLKEFYVPQISSPSWVTLDVTDLIKDIYKYEASRLNMGEDIQNILQTGFMLTAENYSDKSLIVMRGHTDLTFKPKISWERLPRGFYSVTPDETRYFYVDGTTRYGRLLVRDSDREPISYIKTVHERIRQEDIKFTSEVTVALTADPPADFVATARVYGETSKAVGTISSITNRNLFVSMDIKEFSAGETIRLLSDESVTATISTVTYTGNKFVKLSRAPVSDSIIRVYHTGSATTPATPPATYPEYTTWTEAGSGIEPVFISTVSGTLNNFATRDDDELDIIHLNSSDDASTIGDVIVTYQYQYDFILLGRVVAGSDSISTIEGCNRVGSGLYAQSENDYLYKSELMLPRPSTGEFPDISGSSLADEYSDYNLGILSDAVENIRRYNGQVEVFKYGIQDKNYRFGLSYHTFLRGV